MRLWCLQVLPLIKSEFKPLKRLKMLNFRSQNTKRRVKNLRAVANLLLFGEFYLKFRLNLQKSATIPKKFTKAGYA